MNIAEVFNIAAKDYDATRKKYISCFDDFYGVAIDQVPYSQNDCFKILDLGAGSGLFSALLKSFFPSCRLTLTDISSEMLEKAMERFSNDSAVDFIVRDYITQEIPGKYDVIISGLSLHHSTKSEFSTVIEKVFSCLSTNGIFINADQILGRTPQIEKRYEKAWIEKAIESGCTEHEIGIALKRMKADKTLTLSTQLSILEAHGFQNINCWYQYYRFAVYSGVKCT
ncbi:MAG: class I SAM-dependent methyltransferase [bacterium]|nr:class I SAM-dependent methyltransferase [bacterium]